MDMKPLVEYIKQNRESLVIALENYRQDPAGIRNMFAEQGKEVTPSELKEFCDLLESLINTTVD
jgi:hypothetical protein